MYIPVGGYAPDLEPTTPGLLKQAQNTLPTKRGIEAFPGPTNTSFVTASASVVGAASLVKLDGTVRTFHATATKLFEDNSPDWTEVSRSATYAAAVRWRFGQFGDESLAVSDNNPLQGSVTGAFVDITGSVQAAIVLVGSRQAVLLNTNDGTFGDSPDRWRTSAQDDVHDWTPSIATLAASGRLVDTPGEITGGAFLGDDLVVFKETSIYLGRFASPEGYQFSLVESEVGCFIHEAIVNISQAQLAFMGSDDFYIFDSSRVKPIGAPIKEWFFGTAFDRANRSLVVAAHDRPNSRVIWWYPSAETGAGVLDRYVAFHYQVPRWTHGSVAIQFAFPFIQTTGPTYNTLGNFFATYNDLPAITYDSTFWGDTQRFVGIWNSQAQLQTLSGDGQDTSVTFWDMGRDGRYTFFSRIRPRFAALPSTAKLVTATADALGSMPSGSSTSVLSNGKFDMEKEARWFQHRMTTEGSPELLGIDIEAQEGGSE